MRWAGVSIAAAALFAAGVSASTGEHRPYALPPGIEKIDHVVMIVQENRSFDQYFGTYPGADGIPPGVCVSDPRGGCVRPFHLKADRNVGGPHALNNAIRDIDGGAMDGFVAEAARATHSCVDPDDPFCTRAGSAIPAASGASTSASTSS